MPVVAEGPRDPEYMAYLRRLREEQIAQQQLQQQQQAQEQAQLLQQQEEEARAAAAPPPAPTATAPAPQTVMSELPSIQSKLSQIEEQGSTVPAYDIPKSEPIAMNPKIEAPSLPPQNQNQGYDMRYEGFMAVSGAGGIGTDPVIVRQGDPGFNEDFLVTPATQQILEAGQSLANSIRESGNDPVVLQHGGSFMDVSGAGSIGTDPVFNPNVAPVRQSDIVASGSQIAAGAVGSVESLWAPTVPSVWGAASLDAEAREQTAKFMEENPGYLVGNIAGEVIQAVVGGEVLKGALGLGHEAGAIKIQRFQEIPTSTVLTREGRGDIRGTARIFEEIQSGKIERVGKPQWTTEALEGFDVKPIRGEQTKGLMTATWEPGRYTRVDVFDEGLGSKKITRTVRTVEETVDPSKMRFQSYGQEIKTSAQEKRFTPWQEGYTWRATISEDVASGRANKPLADSLMDPRWIYRESGQALKQSQASAMGMTEGQAKAWTSIVGKSALEQAGPSLAAASMKGLVGSRAKQRPGQGLIAIPDLPQRDRGIPKIPDAVFDIPIRQRPQPVTPIPKLDIEPKPITVTPTAPGPDPFPPIEVTVPVPGQDIITTPIAKPRLVMDEPAPRQQQIVRQAPLQPFRLPKQYEFKAPKRRSNAVPMSLGRSFKYEERKNPFSLFLMPKAWRKGKGW